MAQINVGYQAWAEIQLNEFKYKHIWHFKLMQYKYNVSRQITDNFSSKLF